MSVREDVAKTNRAAVVAVDAKLAKAVSVFYFNRTTSSSESTTPQAPLVVRKKKVAKSGNATDAAAADRDNRRDNRRINRGHLRAPR